MDFFIQILPSFYELAKSCKLIAEKLEESENMENIIPCKSLGISCPSSSLNILNSGHSAFIFMYFPKIILQDFNPCCNPKNCMTHLRNIFINFAD